MSQEKPRGVPLRKIATAAFILGLVQGLGSVVRDCALTCHVGFRYAPIAFLIVAALSLPFVALQLKMQRRWGEESYRVRSTVVIAASLLCFRVMLALLRGDAGPSGSSAVVSYVGFFVWVDVAFMLLGAQLFALIQGDEQETDRGLTYFAAAIYAGGFLGGALTGGLNRFFIDILHLPMDVARDHLMIPMAISLLLLVPIAATHSNTPSVSSASAVLEEPSKSEGGGFSEAFRVLGGDAAARQVTTAFVLASAAAICLESLFYWVLTLNAQGGTGFVQLLASLAIWMNGASLVLAAGGSARIIRRLGIAASVLTVPACLLLGSGYLLVGAALTVMLAMRVLKDSLSGGLYEPASERMLVRLQGDRYGKQRPIFEVASRMGTGFGALVVLALTLYFEASLQTLIIVTIVVHLTWFISLIPLARKVRVPVPTIPTMDSASGGSNG